MTNFERTKVRIFEVGPRDGLQNEDRKVSLKSRVRFIEDLVKAGVEDLELGAFVRGDRVPQMADTPKLFELMRRGALDLGQARGWVLVPNVKGFDRAVRAGATHLAVFTAASGTFSEKNSGQTIEESLREIRAVVKLARASGMNIRGYVSTAFACPFEGWIPPSRTLEVMEEMVSAGIDRISVGDTIGKATPDRVEAVIGPALERWGVDRIAVHFHDTRGTALGNALRSLQLGVRAFDTSAGGLGGCPFAPGAAGNLATEDLVYMLEGMGYQTNIDLDKLCKASLDFLRRMKRPAQSRFLQAHQGSVGG